PAAHGRPGAKSLVLVLVGPQPALLDRRLGGGRVARREPRFGEVDQHVGLARVVGRHGGERTAQQVDRRGQVLAGERAPAGGVQSSGGALGAVSPALVERTQLEAGGAGLLEAEGDDLLVLAGPLAGPRPQPVAKAPPKRG